MEEVGVTELASHVKRLLGVQAVEVIEAVRDGVGAIEHGRCSDRARV